MAEGRQRRLMERWGRFVIYITKFWVGAGPLGPLFIHHWILIQCLCIVTDTFHEKHLIDYEVPQRLI